MKHRIIYLTVLYLFVFGGLSAQNVLVEGYVFESGNRGYLNQVNIQIIDESNGAEMANLFSDPNGKYSVELPSNKKYTLYAKKQLFKSHNQSFNTNPETGNKIFLKTQLEREPGYDFEVTLAPKRNDDNIPVDAIKGAWIEVYNNTTKEEVLNLKDHPELEFDVHFDQGNHYTVMIRKDGFLTKRMEAYVNVEGCILCFDGVGSIQPGVVDNLSEGNQMGVLLANVELEPIFSGRTFEIENIYYDFNKATLRPEAKVALQNLAQVLKDNPHVKVELGSHTDSRGKTEDNQKLSEARANAAVDYLTKRLDISPKTIIAAGYGETQLTNNCEDGVNCSEEEHQKNRRTEIKILNIDNAKKQAKTLAEIRIEEEFLKSVMSGDNEVKKVNEDEEKGSDNTEDSVKLKGNQTEGAVEVNKETNIKIAPKPMIKEREPVLTKVDDAQSVDPAQLKGGSKKKSSDKPKKIIGNYTGYRIVIQFSKDPISNDHEIYSRHKDLVEYKSPSGTMLYMIGAFDKYEEADQFMISRVNAMYPGAYIVHFIDGVRQK